MNALPVCVDRYMKTKITTYGNKVYTICDFNVPGDGVKCDSFIITSIDSLLVYENKCYLQVYLDKWTYKIVSTQAQMLDYLDDNLFQTDED